MEEKVFVLERQNLEETLVLVEEKLNKVIESSSNLNSIFDDSNNEYFEYLKRNANKINEEDIVELVNMQTRLGDLEVDSDTLERERKAYDKMLDKPYFAKINLKADDTKTEEQYYIGLHSLVDDNKEYRVIDWRSPIASIFYDYEKGPCSIKTNSSILKCNLLNKRQFGIGGGKFCDGQVLVSDDLLGKYDRFKPKFARQYSSLKDIMFNVAKAFCADVENGAFPSVKESFVLEEEEIVKLENYR